MMRSTRKKAKHKKGSLNYLEHATDFAFSVLAVKRTVGKAVSVEFGPPFTLVFYAAHSVINLFLPIKDKRRGPLKLIRGLQRPPITPAIEAVGTK